MTRRYMILLINLFSFCVPEIVALTDPQMMSKERFQKHLGFKLKLLKDTEKATSQWSRKPSEKDNAFPQQLDTLQESLPPFEIPLKGLLRKNVKIQNLRTLRIRINKVIRPILMRINGKLQNKTATSLLWIKSTTENVSESGSNSTKQTDPQEVASGINSTQNIVQVEVTNGRNSTQKIALADVTSKSETQPLELTETVVNTGTVDNKMNRRTLESSAKGTIGMLADGLCSLCLENKGMDCSKIHCQQQS